MASSFSSDSSDAAMSPNTGKTRQRLKSMKLKAKDKVAQLKNRSGHRGVDHLDSETHEALPDLDSDPAFNPAEVQETLVEHHETLRSKVDRTGTKIEHVLNSVVHPQQSARAKAARETADMLTTVPGSKPTHHEDSQLLDAQDNLEKAKKDTTVDNVLKEDEEKAATVDVSLDRVMNLEEHRDKMKVGYAMTHVNRVRVVNDRKYQWPRREDYFTVDENGQLKLDWKNYLGSILLYEYQGFGAHYIDDCDEHPFEVSVMRSHIERLALVTAPWQAWFMDIRTVYRWDNPVRTMRWLLIYLAIWWTQHMIAYIVAWIMYSVLRNRFILASSAGIRQSLKRAADSQSTAWHLGELMDKHSSDDWLDEVGKTLGPDAQLMVGDIVDLLEVLQNFQDWKSPKYTMAALVLLFTQLVICFSTWELAAHYLYGVIGLMFFLCWPIQSAHPKYRYVASLVNIFLFNIPNNAQWAFSYLRRQALLGQLNVLRHEQESEGSTGHSIRSEAPEYHRHGDILVLVDEDGLVKERNSVPAEYEEEYFAATGGQKSEVSPSVSDDLPPFVEELGSTPLISFHADWEGKHGRLVITASGMHFKQAISKKLAWTLPFDLLHEMRKLDRASKLPATLRALTKNKAVSSGDRLLLQEVNGKGRILQLPRDRDECFNCIIGFSGLSWQTLQNASAQYVELAVGSDG